MLKTVTEHIRDRILRHLGIEPFEFGGKGDDLWKILDTQLDWEFLSQIGRKSVMGFYRYGNNRDPHGKRHDHINRIRLEIDKYLASGNAEHLEEIAIYAMLENMKAPLGRGTLAPERFHRVALDDSENDPSHHAQELEK
jgi:hypothetical protein